MFPYWFLFGIFAIGSLQYRRRNTSSQNGLVFLRLGAILIALMIGLRYDVGADWLNYIRIFEDVRYLPLDTALSLGDPGYAALNWLSHQFGFDIWFVNLLCAILFTWGLVQFARQQPNPWLAILVAVPYLVIVVAMGYTRQGVAIGLVMAGLAAFNRSSILRFLLYVALATLFHKSAVIVIPLVAMAITRNRILLGALFLIMTVMLYYYLVASAIDVMMVNYVGAEYNSAGAAFRVGMSVVPALCFLYFRKRFGLSPEQQKVWRNFSFGALAATLFLIISPSSAAVDRLALFLIPLQMFVLSRLPEVFPDRQRANSQILLAVIVYSALIQFVWFNFGEFADYWRPYKAFFISET